MISSPIMASPWPLRATWVTVITAGIGAGAVLGLVQARVGPLPAVVCIAAAAAGFLVARPAAAVAVLAASVVLAEADSRAILGQTSGFYRSVEDLPLSPVIVLLGLAVIAVAVHLRHGGWAAVVPSGFGGPLALIAATVMPGVLTGVSAGANRLHVLSELVAVGALLVVPLLFAWAVRTSFGVRRIVAIVALLGAAKAGEGLVSWVLGAGRSFRATTITFYEPTPLWLLALCILGTLAAVLSRTPMRPWAIVSALLALACLGLSLRRGFWVGTTLGIALCLLIASGRRGRAVIVPAALLVAVALGVSLRSGGASDSRNVAIERARSLAPSRLALDDEDRYRLEEQANVREEIVRRPLTGTGVGVPWRARVPLSVERTGGRFYTHFVLLWYWLKLGVLGAVGYLWLVASAVRAGGRVWRNHPDAGVRAAGLAAAVGFVTLAVVETTASFTGVSLRFTIFAGSVIGWLAAAGSEAGSESVARTER